jgi:hypothetical protein
MQQAPKIPFVQIPTDPTFNMTAGGMANLIHNKYIVYALCFGIAIYIAFLEDRTNDKISDLINNTFVKILFMVAVLLLCDREPILAIMVAILYLYLTNIKYNEEFANINNITNSTTHNKSRESSNIEQFIEGFEDGSGNLKENFYNQADISKIIKECDDVCKNNPNDSECKRLSNFKNMLTEILTSMKSTATTVGKRLMKEREETQQKEQQYKDKKDSILQKFDSILTQRMNSNNFDQFNLKIKK